MPNKWLEWTPDSDEIIPERSTGEPSKLSEPGFEGFEGHHRGLFPIIQGQEGNLGPAVDTIKETARPGPSRRSESLNESAQAHRPTRCQLLRTAWPHARHRVTKSNQASGYTIRGMAAKHRCKPASRTFHPMLNVVVMVWS